MPNPPAPRLPRGAILAFAADLVALILCLVVTITGTNPWPSLVVSLCAFAAANLIWIGLKRAGHMHPLVTSAWALGIAALAWSIGLVVAG